MTWTDPSTYVAGTILTAASLNTNVRDNSLAGGPIYATEVARLAAIPAPFEGQRAYLTASAVASTNATGDTATDIPTGIQTIYNGTGWVCVTPVSGLTSALGTTTAVAMGNLTGGGTNPVVTVTTGATALVTVTAVLANNTAGQGAYMGVAVSGATIIAAGIINCLYNGGPAGQYFQASATFIIQLLTAGINIFTPQYRAGGGGTASFGNRRITVQGIA